MSNLISLEMWCESTGFPKTTFRGWKSKLELGTHYFKIGRVTAIDPLEIEKWLRESGGDTGAGSSRLCFTANEKQQARLSRTPKLVSERR
jgi:hypothetical protein